MSDILNMYGPNSSQPQAAPASDGGRMEPKPLSYSPPVGPKSINDPKTPGIHGTNHGICGTQGKY